MLPEEEKTTSQSFMSAAPVSRSEHAPEPVHSSSAITDLRYKLESLFNKYIPNDRRYLGIKRKPFILILLFVCICLPLVLGLAIGLPLSNRPKYRDLPRGSNVQSGDLTYYSPGLGACGKTSSDSDNIVSISHFVFDAVARGSNPNANPLCGHNVRAVRNGASVDLVVVDRCVGCQPSDLDVSLSAFKKLADPDLGRVHIQWAWLPPVPDIP